MNGPNATYQIPDIIKSLGNLLRFTIAPRRRHIGILRSAPAILGIIFAVAPRNANAQDIGVTVNGQSVAFQGIGPQQVNGRVLVPVRGVLERIGADVSWMPQTRTVIAANGKIDIQLKIGDQHALVNARDVLLDVPAQVIAGSTFVPLRFLGEALGADVRWDGPAHTVVIVTPDQPNRGGDAHPAHLPDHPDRPDRDNRDRHRGPAPTIDSLTQDARGWLRAGDTIHVLMEGTPGGRAAFRIPGLAAETPMRETSPGRYQGVWQVPIDKPIQLAQAAVIGSLTTANGDAPLLQAAQPVTVDAIAPQIKDIAPGPEAHVNAGRPNIYAVFEDQGSGIDPGATHLLLNGRDITGQATVTREFVSYTPNADLAGGPQTVQLVISDRAGNRAETAWKFMEDRREAAGIRTVIHNANHRLEPGDTLRIEISGTPGARADFSLGNIRGVPLTEKEPGHYVSDYTVRKGDDVNGMRVLAHLMTPDGAKFERQSDIPITISTGKPAAPEIVYPGPRDVPGNPLVVKGTAQPNSRVRVRIDYRTNMLGLMAVKGTAIDAVVATDKRGNWQTAPINLNGLLGTKGVEYTIAATAINAAAEQSDTASAHFRLR